MSGSDLSTHGGITIRTDLRPGDIGTIVRWHGVTYAREHGFDHTFEAYVAGPLSHFALHRTRRDCIWIAEHDGQLAGCIAVVGASPTQAQLRWYLVDASVRGRGLGRLLLDEAVQFARRAGYESIFLWTVSALTAAAHLYRQAGFELVESRPGAWGAAVTEEKYVLKCNT